MAQSLEEMNRKLEPVCRGAIHGDRLWHKRGGPSRRRSSPEGSDVAAEGQAVFQVRQNTLARASMDPLASCETR